MTQQHTGRRPATAPASPAAGPAEEAGDEAGSEALRELAAAELLAARERTTLLTSAVDEADLVKQHSPLMSPLVWDLAHIANQEELWLLRAVGGRDPMHPEIDPLYDAFEHPRAERPTLPLLTPVEARRYGHEVRGRVLDLIEKVKLPPGGFGGELTGPGSRFAFGMVAQHEVQHDETMLATHQLRSGPAVLSAPPPPAPADAAALPAEVHVPGGPFTMGTSAEPWALDNERPAHAVDVPGFWLDTTPVTNAAYAEFIADGGYDDRRLWTADGWAHRQRAGLTAPLFWSWEGEWVRRSFGVREPVVPDEPVVHVCWYEADAYARWAGRRLPTEAEWEKAARWDPASGRSRRYPWGDQEWTPERANLGQRHLRPAPAGAYPDGAAPCGARQLIGDVWEWTSSDFLPYPGFSAWPYKEYSEVFFGPEYKVLRGGAFGVSPVACRGTFRNWDYPIRRQIFAGFRTARSDTGRSGTGRSGTGRSGTGRSGTGRSGTGRSGTGRSGTGRSGTGRSGTGQPGTGRPGSGARLMCRHLAYAGPPASLRSLLIDPPHSLYRQAWAPRLQRHGTVNADGFGIGWYGAPDPVPARYRRAVPIWGDASLPDIARVTRSGAVLAAVRSATEGTALGEAAAAPFGDGPWLFSHNGLLDGWPGAAAAIAAGAPQADAGAIGAAALLSLEAMVDSAFLWALVLGRLRAGQVMGPALARTIAAVEAAGGTGRFNFLLTDGHSIAATACGDTLWYRQAGEKTAERAAGRAAGAAPADPPAPPASVVIASEPTDDEPGWVEVPDRHLVTATAGRVSVRPLAAAGAPVQLDPPGRRGPVNVPPEDHLYPAITSVPKGP